MDDYSLNLTKASSQYASIADGSQTGLDITGDISIEAWIWLKSQPASNEQYVIASKYNSTGNQRSYSFSYNDSEGTKELRLIYSDDGTYKAGGDLKLTQTLETGKWIHVSATFDASASKVIWYVDGSTVGNVTG